MSTINNYHRAGRDNLFADKNKTTPTTYIWMNRKAQLGLSWNGLPEWLYRSILFFGRHYKNI